MRKTEQMPVTRGRMRFTIDDAGGEDAFHRRRDELGTGFAGWLARHGVPGDPSDADLLMDWKVGYSDGALDTWTVADVEEFLLGWCPRKLSAAPQDCAGIPQSVAGFVEFLADERLLGRRSQSPRQIRTHCERTTDRFVREMGNPAAFGMAKSLFGGVGGLEPGAERTPEALAGLLERLGDLPPEAVEELLGHLGVEGLDDPEDSDPPIVGPVRLPSPDERLAAVLDAPDLRRLRLLAQWCPAPGRALTVKGNVRVADARHLVEALDTGDDPELGGYRKLTSATDLPRLSYLVETALAVGVVRRQRGRLVAVARFAALGDVEAHGQVVRAAVDAGLAGPTSYYFPGDAPIIAALDAHVVTLLTRMLADSAEGADGTDRADLVELASAIVRTSLAVLGVFGGGSGVDLVPSRVRRQLERLVGLGMVTITGADEPCPDCDEPHEIVTLTAAGVPIAVDLAREAGFEVLLRPEPATASAGEIVDLLGIVDPEDWARDATAWLAARPDPTTGATELVAAITAEDNALPVVAAGLSAIEDVLGELAADAVRAHLDGPRDGLVLQWLLTRSMIEPTGIEPARLMVGMVDMMSVLLDVGGPEEVLAGFQDSNTERQLQLLDGIWRLDHPRLAEILEVIGEQHPVKAVAKAARRAVMKHRSRVASR